VIAAQFPEGFVDKWSASLDGAQFFGQPFEIFSRQELVAVCGWLADQAKSSESRAQEYARHQFDAFRPYSRVATRRQEVVYWPEVDRRVEKSERRAEDRVVRAKP